MSDFQKVAAENEHLKNTLAALHDKLLVFNDLKRDLQSHKDMLSRNERARDTLQTSIET